MLKENVEVTKVNSLNRRKFGNVSVEDHPTLGEPSSSLTFTNKQTKVFTIGQEQIILEKSENEDQAIAKQVDFGSPGLFLMRLAYTLVAFLMSGFCFIFCEQLILFLFLGLAIESGLTSSSEDFTFLVFIGVLFAIPAFLYSMSHWMTVAMAFTQDVWGGNKMMKTTLSYKSVIMDWIHTSVFFFVPILVAACYLYAGSEKWWDKTLISWFIVVFAYFMTFLVSVVYHEIDGCLQLIRYSDHSPIEYEENEGRFNLKTIVAAFRMKMKHKLSGVVVASYNASGTDPSSSGMSLAEIQDKYNSNVSGEDGVQLFRKSRKFYDYREHRSVYARLTQFLACCGLFEKKEEPQRQHNVDDVLGYAPFVTNSTWGLESMYCRNRKRRFVAVVDGESAMTREQGLSSSICYFIGMVLTLFSFVAFMVWMDLPAGAIGVLCAFYAIFCIRSVLHTVKLKGMYDNLRVDTSNGDESEVLYQVQETFRITEPTDTLCWMVLFLELVFLFVIPVGALYHSGNVPVATLFIFTSIVTFARRYCNSTIAVQEFGSLDGIEKDNTYYSSKKSDDPKEVKRQKDEEWREKHRLGYILTNISSGNRVNFWMSVFTFFIIAFCGVFMTALIKGSDKGSLEGGTYTQALQYPGSNNLEYASCMLGREITPPDSTETSLADFTFLTKIAYEDPGVAQESLDAWFGAGTATVQNDIVVEFKEEYERENGKSAVEYKLFKFPGPNVGIVSIRGTSNGWDALSDAQLWSAAALAQWVRALMPLGTWFNPILTHLVNLVSSIESEHLAKVAFYRQTAAFVEDLKEKNEYGNLLVTGHSLGGGLAMITGAQTKVPAIALSGPNAVISGSTFDPPVSLKDLEKYTFNIVPDRDVVPRLDDLSQNYQRINCRTGLNDPISCHFGIRSLCEVLLSCGSHGRPVPCACLGMEDIYTDQLELTNINSGLTLEETIQQECPVNASA